MKLFVLFFFRLLMKHRATFYPAMKNWYETLNRKVCYVCWKLHRVHNDRTDLMSVFDECTQPFCVIDGFVFSKKLTRHAAIDAKNNGIYALFVLSNCCMFK